MTHTTSETPKPNKNTKSNKKIHLKGGSILENDHQEDNTEFFILARKMVDNL